MANAYSGSLPDSEIFRVSAAQVTRGDANKDEQWSRSQLVSTDPGAAVALLNTYAETYVSLRQVDRPGEPARDPPKRLQDLLIDVGHQIEDRARARERGSTFRSPRPDPTSRG